MRGAADADADAASADEAAWSSATAIEFEEEEEDDEEEEDKAVGGAKLDGSSHETGASSTPCTSSEHQGTLNSLLMSL